MGSSMGGFTSEYMAMKLQTQAIMVNPAILPSELLTQFIGVTEKFETKQCYDWQVSHCQQYKPHVEELKQCFHNFPGRTVLLDMADELLDSSRTADKYKNIANVVTFEGDSHEFEHMLEALPMLSRIINNLA